MGRGKNKLMSHLLFSLGICTPLTQLGFCNRTRLWKYPLLDDMSANAESFLDGFLSGSLSFCDFQYPPPKKKKPLVFRFFAASPFWSRAAERGHIAVVVFAVVIVLDRTPKIMHFHVIQRGLASDNQTWKWCREFCCRVLFARIAVTENTHLCLTLFTC